MSYVPSSCRTVVRQDPRHVILSCCGAATLANALLKRGFCNSFLVGLKAVGLKQRQLIGPAWTVRFIPAR